MDDVKKMLERLRQQRTVTARDLLPVLTVLVALLEEKEAAQKAKAS